jgi:hypothetical protein
MSDHEQQDRPDSAAEQEGIVDQQDAALAAIDEVEDQDDDPMAGEAPSG